MPEQGLIFRILIASPSDCTKERTAIRDVIYSWNAANSQSKNAVLVPVLWETHTRPQLGDRPQAIINRQLVENCDMLVGTFWTRLGTSTGKAKSGTVEEIEQFLEAKKPVVLYFSQKAINPKNIDSKQLEALRDYQNRIEKEGIVDKYDSVSKLEKAFRNHLSMEMDNQLKLHPVPEKDFDSPEEDDPRGTLQNFRSELASFLRRFTAEWETERDSEPTGIDDAKLILSSARNELHSLQSEIITDNTDLITSLMRETVIDLRKLEKVRLFADGGKSFREFWQRGNSVIVSLQKIIEKIDWAIEELKKDAE